MSTNGADFDDGCEFWYQVRTRSTIIMDDLHGEIKVSFSGNTNRCQLYLLQNTLLLFPVEARPQPDAI